MSIALLMMTDGRRDYIRQTVESASLLLDGIAGPYVMYDDSGDEQNHQWLRTNFPMFEVIYKNRRQGFGGAIQSAWDNLKIRDADFDFIFHLEDDFTFNRRIPLADMENVLEMNPQVYQMALRRQAWSSEERQAGGVIERWPEAFHQRDGWISHKLFFTTNPSLYRRTLIETRVYPSVKDSEGHFSHSILESDPNAEFGYWGLKTDTPWVEHTGVHRKGSAY